LHRAVVLVRAQEVDTVPLTTCDGTVAPLALDVVSVLVRSADAPRPPVPLADEPTNAWATNGEWVEGVRLVEPSVLWMLQRFAEMFPRRKFLIRSGYRPGSRSLHGMARALDLELEGVANEDLYRACRAQPDMGCGYYPNNQFVHLDLRNQETGRIFWIDTAAPGEPSAYVERWPGVEDSDGASGAWVPQGE